MTLGFRVDTDRLFQDYNNLFCHVSENHPINQQAGRIATRSPNLEINDSFPNPGVITLDNNDKGVTSDDAVGNHGWY